MQIYPTYIRVVVIMHRINGELNQLQLTDVNIFTRASLSVNDHLIPDVQQIIILFLIKI